MALAERIGGLFARIELSAGTTVKWPVSRARAIATIPRLGRRRAGHRDAGVTAPAPDALEAAADPYGYRYADAW